MPADVAELLEQFRRDGDSLALARALSVIESAPSRTLEFGPGSSDRLVHRIGVTGPAGSGKSTLIGRLIGAYRRTGRRVAVLAIDPSSPLTGGAVLGDRFRMEGALDDDVFVRSLATRRAPGAIAVATGSMLRAIESTGRFDVVLVETVGAGQADVAVAALVDTVVLVTVPGLGDAVQAIKAGLLEVADIVVVNKGDRPGALRTASQLRAMLVPTVARNMGDTRPRPKRPEVLVTTATTGEGLDELLDAIGRHRAAGDASAAARGNRAEVQVRAVVLERVLELLAAPGRSAERDEVLAAVAGHRLDPYAAADRLLATLIGSERR